jgi:hypothetical protein
MIGASLVLARRLGPAAPRGRIERIDTVSLETRNYHGWPTLARRRNGELLAVCSGGRESHVCPFGRVELMRSKDDGASWSWPEVLMDSPIDDRDAGVLETSQGTLLVSTFTSLAYEPVLERAVNWPAGRLRNWRAAHARVTAAQRKALLGTWMLRSTDAGSTWSAPYRVPVNSPHGPVSLSGGRLLYAGKQLWEAGRKVGVCESLDDGVSWRWLADIPARPGDSVENYHELHAVEAGSGRIVVHIRNHNQANLGETLQCVSEDGGRSWSAPRSIGVWGLPSHLTRLRDGRLLMSYGHRRKPFGNLARISENGGETWSEPVTISDDGAGTDLGYPSTVELPSGGLATLWYELQAGSLRAVLRLARWRLES